MQRIKWTLCAKVNRSSQAFPSLAIMLGKISHGLLILVLAVDSKQPHCVTGARLGPYPLGLPPK
mgnify:CR=1 FL=1